MMRLIVTTAVLTHNESQCYTIHIPHHPPCGLGDGETARSHGASVHCFFADLADPTQCQRLCDEVAQRFPQWRVLVNSASRFVYDQLDDLTPDGFMTHMQINAFAPIWLARGLRAYLQTVADRADGLHAAPDRTLCGAVINLLDQKLINPNPDFLSYTLSKATLHMATTLLAQSLAPMVRVVGVAPGLTLDSAWMGEGDFERLHRLSPLGRSSTPEDIVQAVRFAIENQALTGTTLWVDGGQHLMPQRRDFSMMTSPFAAPTSEPS
jgi:NAD(P)-dependent dehydrogenase (short-subunit alcohol dehydrogenase family)